MSTNAIRRTEYKDGTPQQTQTSGFQQVGIAVLPLFEQALDLMQAEALERIVLGERFTKSELDYFRRQFRCAKNDLEAIDGLSAAMPAPIHFDSDDFSASCRKIGDLVYRNGAYRTHFVTEIESVVDANQNAKEGALQGCIDQVRHQHGIQPALLAAKKIQNELHEMSNRPIQNSFTDRDEKSLLRCVRQIRAATEELDGHSWWQRRFKWRKRREIAAQRSSQMEKARKLTAKRINELEQEAIQQLSLRLLGATHANSLSDSITTLERLADRLVEIATQLRSDIVPLKDTVTVTHIIQRADEILLSGNSLADIWADQCERLGCGASVHAEMLKLGLQVQGRIITLTRLAEMTNEEAVECLRLVNSHLHNDAVIDNILKTDLATPSLEMHLIEALKLATDKASPYLETIKIQSVSEINELYLFANPLVRGAVSNAMPATVNISNPEEDKRLHIDQRHTIAIYRSRLTCGHARPSYLKGLLVKRRLEASGKRHPIYNLNQSLGNPLVIKNRPTSEQDSETLFQLGLDCGSIAKVKIGDEDCFTVAPMDDTVKFCFEVKVHKPRSFDATQLRQLMTENWFVPYVDGCGLDLSASWNEEIINVLSCETADETARRLVAIGVAKRDGRRFRFAIPFSKKRIAHAELYDETIRLRKGLSKSRFIRKMLTIDELYTRVFVDVLLAERGMQIERRQLPPFAKAFLADMFDGEIES